MLTAIAGGVGAARLLRGVIDVRPGSTVTAIVNTGDDAVIHGLHVSPDLDTVTYTLADAIDPERGWGLVNETWSAIEALDRYGVPTWFRLGDRDLATHIYRTERLRWGEPLSRVTADIARAWGLDIVMLPMSDDPVATRVTTGDGEIGFQEYFVERQHSVAVSAVRFDGADAASPAPGVLDAIASAERVVICPSNPIVSIGPVLAVPGIRDALVARRDDAVAVSPIIAGAALKGPADRMLRELGHEASVVGVARLYRELARTLVIDEADAALASSVEAEGIGCIVAPTIMHSPAAAAALAEVVIGA